MNITSFFGEQRSLVAHLVWDQGVEGSNPFSPTIFLLKKNFPPFLFLNKKPAFEIFSTTPGVQNIIMC